MSFLTSKTDGTYSPSVFFKIAENRQLGDKPASKTPPNLIEKRHAYTFRAKIT